MLQRYNIVLLPEAPQVQAHFQALAQKYFSKNQQQYLLGSEGLAHVTLCQFRAKSGGEALEAFKTFTQKHTETITVETFRLRVDPADFWAEYLVGKKQTLMQMQKACFDHLVQRGHEVFVFPQTYSPHITLARLLEPTDFLPTREDLPWQGEIAVRPAVGVSTEKGLFVRELAPTSLVAG